MKSLFIFVRHFSNIAGIICLIFGVILISMGVQGGTDWGEVGWLLFVPAIALFFVGYLCEGVIRILK